MDIYSFDLKMVVFRSMVKDKAWIFVFFIRKYALFHRPKQSKDFSFFEETISKFPRSVALK